MAALRTTWLSLYDGVPVAGRQARFGRLPTIPHHAPTTRMPVTVFDVKGVPATRRDQIVTAVEAGGKDATAPYEAWIATDAVGGVVRVLLTAQHGFERTVQFAVDEQAVAEKDAEAKWKLILAAAEVPQFQADVYDVLIVCGYVVASVV